MTSLGSRVTGRNSSRMPLPVVAEPPATGRAAPQPTLLPRGVSGNCAFEESIGSSDTGQPLEFKLQLVLGVVLAGAGGDGAAHHGAYIPAAGAVFEAGEVIQKLLVKL